ncbi:hypothetical protein [Pleionea sediminis]|uniref:hypothetical protein n=1 Tax=Pleionea sediminis TaxID=2569479 RepID=UPI00118525A4|nr:hypothetical protein [Pleionea sediminis]
MRHLLIGLTFSCFCLSVYAKESEKSGLPIRYFSTVPGDAVMEKIMLHPKFNNAQEELPGSPIVLRVVLEQRQDVNNPASFTTGLLAATSLGILPAVMSEDILIRYEVFVNGNSIVDFEFTESFTEVKNIFAGRDSSKLDPEIEQWVLTTTDQFLSSVEKSKEFKELEKEYDFYFGS